eukprot:3220675-Amphidinium_carterae.1
MSEGADITNDVQDSAMLAQRERRCPGQRNHCCAKQPMRACSRWEESCKAVHTLHNPLRAAALGSGIEAALELPVGIGEVDQSSATSKELKFHKADFVLGGVLEAALCVASDTSFSDEFPPVLLDHCVSHIVAIQNEAIFRKGGVSSALCCSPVPVLHTLFSHVRILDGRCPGEFSGAVELGAEPLRSAQSIGHFCTHTLCSVMALGCIAVDVKHHVTIYVNSQWVPPPYACVERRQWKWSVESFRSAV